MTITKEIKIGSVKVVGDDKTIEVATDTIIKEDGIYSDKSFSVLDEETKARGFCFGDNGNKLFVCGWNGDDINQYSIDITVVLSTAPALGTQIKILHKKGQVWYTGEDGNPANGKGLQASTTQQAKFIANEPTNAPE